MNLDVNNVSELSQQQNMTTLSINVGAGTSRQPNRHLLFHSYAQTDLVGSIATFKKFTKSNKKSTNLNDGHESNESSSSQCISIECKAPCIKKIINVENASDRIPLNNFEKNVCSTGSPESGFGSDHQCIPSHIDANNIANVAAEAKLSENKLFAKTYQSFSNKDSGTDEEVIQIVNISSLAQAVSKGDKKKKKYPRQTQRQAYVKGSQIEHISTVPTTRLCILHSGNKRALHFDPTLSKDSSTNTNSDVCISEMPISSSLSTPCYHISFSGLPVIAKRKNYVLSKEGIDGFVSSLTKHAPRKLSDDQPLLHSNTVSLSKTTSQKCHNSFHKIIANETKVCVSMSDLPHKTEVTGNSDISGVIKGNDLHSNSMISVKENKQSKRRHSEISVKTITNFPSSTSFASGNSKADKIKRLKEIIKKREEDLEKVRKNCGFIS